MKSLFLEITLSAGTSLLSHKNVLHVGILPGRPPGPLTHLIVLERDHFVPGLGLGRVRALRTARLPARRPENPSWRQRHAGDVTQDSGQIEFADTPRHEVFDEGLVAAGPTHRRVPLEIGIPVIGRLLPRQTVALPGQH